MRKLAKNTSRVGFRLRSAEAIIIIRIETNSRNDLYMDQCSFVEFIAALSALRPTANAVAF